MITIKEMANMLGVSTTTISNVLHGKTSEVSPATIELVQQTIKECGYIPNISAQNLARNYSKIIGIVMKEKTGRHENMLKDPFYAEVVGAIEQVVRSKGYYLMMHISDNIEEIIKCVNSWNIDGLIVVSVEYEDVRALKKGYKKPMVLIDCADYGEEGEEVNIALDDEKGGYDITEYVIRCGHKKLIYFSYGVDGIAGKRYRGSVRALKKYGYPCDRENFPAVCIGKLGMETAMETIYCMVGQYTAVLCSSDYYAAWLVNHLKDRGVNIPEDISVAGFDDNDFAHVVRPHLTTVKQNVMEKGVKAVHILVDLIEGKEWLQREIILPFSIVVRDSVKIIHS